MRDRHLHTHTCMPQQWWWFMDEPTAVKIICSSFFELSKQPKHRRKMTHTHTYRVVDVVSMNEWMRSHFIEFSNSWTKSNGFSGCQRTIHCPVESSSMTKIQNVRSCLWFVFEFQIFAFHLIPNLHRILLFFLASISIRCLTALKTMEILDKREITS